MRRTLVCCLLVASCGSAALAGRASLDPGAPDALEAADPRSVAHAHLSRSRIYLNEPEVARGGDKATVDAIVGGERCTVHLSRADAKAAVAPPGAGEWRVSAVACR